VYSEKLGNLNLYNTKFVILTPNADDAVYQDPHSSGHQKLYDIETSNKQIILV